MLAAGGDLGMRLCGIQCFHGFFTPSASFHVAETTKPASCKAGFVQRECRIDQ
jgi:hypothetical protein